jgi:G3E family GTPase
MMEDDSDDEAPFLVSVDPVIDPDASPLTASLPLMAEAQRPILPPCPVTILSGFLGSGKTTLIQRLLQSPDHGKRIAVIENEYGDGSLNTDTNNNNNAPKDGLQKSIESLIAQDISKNNNNSLSDWIELPNGCLCCTVKDKLVTTLEHLINIKGGELDCILIEMSGMALPGPLASLFWLDDVREDDEEEEEEEEQGEGQQHDSSISSIQSRLRLDGIVTVVDAYHIDSQLQNTFEAACQIAQADRILVNKMDLVSSTTTSTDAVPNILATLRQMNPTALIQTTSYGQVPDWNWIFDIHSLDMDHRTLQQVEEVWNSTSEGDQQQEEQKQHDQLCTDTNCQNSHHDHGHIHHNQQPHEGSPDDDQACTDPDCQESHHSHSHQHGTHNSQHRHTSGVSTITLSVRGSVDLTKINAWVASILWPHQDEADKVLRARLEQPLQPPPLDDVAQSTVADATATGVIFHDTRDKTTQQIFRMKGILSVRQQITHNHHESRWVDPSTGLDQRYYIVQAVHDLWEIHPSLNEQFLWNDDDRCCKLIVIGRHLDTASLRTNFEECAVVQ